VNVFNIQLHGGYLFVCCQAQAGVEGVSDTVQAATADVRSREILDLIIFYCSIGIYTKFTSVVINAKEQMGMGWAASYYNIKIP